MSDLGYAGDIGVEETWEILKADPAAVLVDVRTDAEWNYVGIPDLSSVEKKPVLLPWQLFPTMQVNQAFLEQLDQTGAAKDAPVLFLCRSGVRSQAAAIAATGAGYSKAFNVAHGFEGPHDDTKHRGSVAGWKAAGLPWVQG